ncbi:putative C6 transcription factor [Aspergillus thermomutatus]|uniref:Xylanolytic transcriptional activator regulatory domain-containing protein n=1 Tax=Aspergillus thermomutatus TaxID=41047 RepID=A0A397GQS4_ASPTH|nr:uncharacterized protein CDV56_106083 [Aspergillus thermomutatus]RHZ52917.1 hypothetical protein CDV56_106083 [Aspergillus thermomutatus]
MDVLSFEIFLESLGPEKSCWVTGNIDYSGMTLEDVRKYYRGEVIYVPEDDVHFPTLNVQQTLEFALQSKTPKRYQERIPRYLEIYGRVFGMSHTMKTLVGNEYIRGVSGGERKRISIIESLATDSSVMCWDNSTRGLDASSALDYVRSLRIMTDTCGKATLLTLYQASDAIFDLVDKVLLIDEGRMLYQGPAYEAKGYFENLGYQCAEAHSFYAAPVLSGNSSTDLQSKAFSCFLVLMLVPEFINAISMRFILNRDLWKARDPVELVFYVLYYFLVGLPLGFAAAYTFLMFFLFFLFATSWGQWIAALSADSMVAATLMPFFIIMCELFNGILQPHKNMPVFWKYTMYYLTPFTYWIGGVLTSVLRGMPVICSQDELAIFESPLNMTCGEYAMPWLSSTGSGYLSNPDGRGNCGYCKYSRGDDYLSEIGLDESKIWPYLGIFTAFVISNYLMVYALVYRLLNGPPELSIAGKIPTWDQVLIATPFKDGRRPGVAVSYGALRIIAQIRSTSAQTAIIMHRPQAGSLSSVRRAGDQDTTVSDRARASTDRGSPVYSGVYVFDSKHQPFPTRVAKPKNRSDEMQELRNRVLTLENALAKASSIQTPETLGAEPSIVSESGPRTMGDEHYLSEDIRSLPWASFRGKKTNTTYCGRSHSASSLSFFRDVGEFLRQRKSRHKKDSEYGSLRQFKKEMWLKERQEQQQRARREQASSLVDLLPPRRVADELVQLYLSNFETTYRILHIPTFLKQYEDYWTAPENPDMVFLAKLLLLMAASSCFYSPTTKINGKDSLSSTAIHWIEAVQIWSVTSFATRNTNFNMLQVHCLSLIARQANAFDGDSIWVSSGSLIRSAMTMGLHRNPLRFQKLSRFWAEMRRRLWATIQELDLQSSMDGGMPPTIDLEEYDCDPPSNYDDADLVESMTEDPPPKDPGILTRSSFQVLLSRSLPVRVHIAKLVNRLRFTLSYDEALRLSKELMQSLHDALDLFPSDGSLLHIPGVENPAFTKSYFIFLIRRHLLVLHRPFCLSIMQTPKFSYSRKICLDSALDMLSLLEPPLGDVPEAQPHPHLGHLTGGMFREELFHAAIMVCVELVLQADELSRSKSMLPGQSSVLSSLNEMAESKQAVMVRAVENTIKVFGSRIAPGGRGCKPYLFLTITLASVKARLKGEDSFRTMDQAGTNAIRDCHLLMRGVPWADASISTPGLTAGTPLDLPFDPMSFVPSSMEDISPLDFGNLFDMTDYGALEVWNNDFFSGY